MLELGCMLHNLVKICLQTSTSAKFYPFTEDDKDLLEKICWDMVDGPSMVSKRKAVVDKALSRKSSNIWKSIAEIVSSQLCLFFCVNICRLYPILDRKFDEDLQIFKQKKKQVKKLRKNGHVVFSINGIRVLKREILHHKNSEKKLIFSVQTCFMRITTPCLKPWVVFINASLAGKDGLR